MFSNDVIPRIVFVAVAAVVVVVGVVVVIVHAAVDTGEVDMYI